MRHVGHEKPLQKGVFQCMGKAGYRRVFWWKVGDPYVWRVWTTNFPFQVQPGDDIWGRPGGGY